MAENVGPDENFMKQATDSENSESPNSPEDGRIHLLGETTTSTIDPNMINSPSSCPESDSNLNLDTTDGIQSPKEEIQTTESEGSKSEASQETVAEKSDINQQPDDSKETEGESGKPQSASSTSSEGSKKDSAHKHRREPVLDASKKQAKLNEKQVKEKKFREQQLLERQKKISDQREKDKKRREAVEERKRKQTEKDDARKEAILKRAGDREGNIREKRRSWSTVRDPPDSPASCPSTPRPATARGRSSDRATMNRPNSASTLNLNSSRRLSSSVTSLEKTVKLIRLGPYEEDWFECHMTVTKPIRRSSSPGKDDNSFDSPPLHHHLSTPNLASVSMRSAQSTPTHGPKSNSATPRSKRPPGTPVGSGPKKSASARTPGRTPSPGGRPPSPKLNIQPIGSPAGRTPSTPSPASSASSDQKLLAQTPTRPFSPRGKKSDSKRGDLSSRSKSSPSGPPPIKKSLTPASSGVKGNTGQSSKPSTPVKLSHTKTNVKRDKVSTPKSDSGKLGKESSTTKEHTPKTVNTETPKKEKDSERGNKEDSKGTVKTPARTPTHKPKTPKGLKTTAATTDTSKAAIKKESNGDISPSNDLSDEDKAKQALAQRRREAREKAEREAKLEKEKQEQLMREEEEKIRKEEEERRREEEEAMRLAEEHRQMEEERIKKAIEDQARQEQEDREQKEREEQEKVDDEKRRLEDIARRDAELAVKHKKEEEQRDARRKRVDAIMKRARKGAQGTGQEKKSEVNGSGNLNSNDNSPSGSTQVLNQTNSTNSDSPTGDSPTEEDKETNNLVADAVQNVVPQPDRPFSPPTELQATPTDNDDGPVLNGTLPTNGEAVAENGSDDATIVKTDIPQVEVKVEGVNDDEGNQSGNIGTEELTTVSTLPEIETEKMPKQHPELAFEMQIGDKEDVIPAVEVVVPGSQGDMDEGLQHAGVTPEVTGDAV